MPSPVNAPLIISLNASSKNEALIKIIIIAATKYIIAMKGTSLSVTLAMLLIPPIITVPKINAKTSPYNHALSEKKEASCPPVTLKNC